MHDSMTTHPQKLALQGSSSAPKRQLRQHASDHLREAVITTATTVEVWAENAGDTLSDVLNSDSVAWAALATTYLVAGLLIGYALARNLLG
jgi:hypothetical protein